MGGGRQKELGNNVKGGVGLKEGGGYKEICPPGRGSQTREEINGEETGTFTLRSFERKRKARNV